MILSKTRITKALISLHRCAGCSALLLFANPEDIFSHCSLHIWAGVLHKVQVGMCIQPKFKLICASTQPDRSVCFRPAEKLDPWLRTIEHPSKTDKTVWMYMLMDAPDNGHIAPIWTHFVLFNTVVCLSWYLHPSKQFFNNVGAFSSVEPVLYKQWR